MDVEEMHIADTIMQYFQEHRSLEWEYIDTEDLWNINGRKANQVLAQLIRDELLMQRGSFTDLTKKGSIYTTYQSFLIEEEKRRVENLPRVTNITGNTGNVIHDSSLSHFTNSFNEISSSNKPTKPPKRSRLEIITWIVGIIASIVAIYEFIIKQFLK
jgi:hypothetical protein